MEFTNAPAQVKPNVRRDWAEAELKRMGTKSTIAVPHAVVAPEDSYPM